MRSLLIAATMLFGSLTPVLAQNTTHRQPTPEQSKDVVSDEKRAELNALIEKAQKKQAVVDARNSNMWERWTYAVCIGCGDTPKNLRVVHTTPERVLAGVPAADDDAREQSIRRKSGATAVASRAKRRATPDLFASRNSRLNNSDVTAVTMVNGLALGS